MIGDSFTQGGQTQLHKIRMIKQVMVATFKVSIGIFLLSFVLLVYLEHPWQDFWLVGVYAKAYFMSNCPSTISSLSPSSVIYHLGDPQGYSVSDYTILHSDVVLRMLDYISLSLIKKLLQSALIAIVGSVLVSWFWVKMGNKKKETQVLSGFECVDAKVLKKKVLRHGASAYTIGEIPLPKNAEFQHLMITGTTGSGKSNLIHQLLQQIRDQGDQAIVIDTTGGIFARFFEETKDILLNPLDARSKKWNLWQEGSQDYVLDEIAEALIPEGKSYDQFWTQSARQVFCESVRFLKQNNQCFYQALLDMTLQLPLKELKDRLKDTTVSSLIDPAIDKTALSVRASLASHLRSLAVLEEEASTGDTQTSEEELSLLRFLKYNQKTWTFLSCQPDQREFLKPLFSAWISLMIKGIMQRSEGEGSRTWIIIDELASLNRLPSLMLGLSEIRKYGGCFVLGFQDLHQLEDVYGHTVTKSLSNLTGTKVLFRNVDTEVATRVAKYLGEQEKQEASESISYGAHQMRDGVNLSNQKHTKPVVTASQIMMLKDLEAFLKLPGNFPVTKIAFNYIDYPKTAISFVPNKNALKPKKQKETVESNPVAFELFTEDDEILRLKRREKIREKKIEEISDSLQQARENIDNLCVAIEKVKD
jgi:type IV conjugative transfer system coupling protein TraD